MNVSKLKQLKFDFSLNPMRMKPKFIITILVVLIVGGLALTAYYNKPHRNPEKEQALTISATELFNQFVSDETAANSRFLDKVLIVTGNVKTTTRNQQNAQVITIETGDDYFGVQCTLTPQATEVSINDFVAIKGICKGFLSDVVITDAVLTDIKF
jgi:hypothetical protein